MSDFGSTGGDIYTLPIAGGAVTNITSGNACIRAVAPVELRKIICLLAQELAGDRNQLVDFGAATRPVPGKVLWSGAETIEHGEASRRWRVRPGSWPAQWNPSPPRRRSGRALRVNGRP